MQREGGMGNGEWGIGNEEWGEERKFLIPIPHSPFPTPFLSFTTLAEFEKQIGIAVEIAAAPGQFRAVVEDDAIFAVKPGVQFADACDINDLRAVGAQEFRRIQLLI